MRRRRKHISKGFTSFGKPYMLINKMNDLVKDCYWNICAMGTKFGEYSHKTRIKYEDKTMYFGTTQDRAGDERTFKIENALYMLERKSGKYAMRRSHKRR